MVRTRMCKRGRPSTQRRSIPAPLVVRRRLRSKAAGVAGAAVSSLRRSPPDSQISGRPETPPHHPMLAFFPRRWSNRSLMAWRPRTQTVTLAMPMWLPAPPFPPTQSPRPFRPRLLLACWHPPHWHHWRRWCRRGLQCHVNWCGSAWERWISTAVASVFQGCSRLPASGSCCGSSAEVLLRPHPSLSAAAPPWRVRSASPPFGGTRSLRAPNSRLCATAARSPAMGDTPPVYSANLTRPSTCPCPTSPIMAPDGGRAQTFGSSAGR
mmetsp:Transcript_10407/g.29687  ORF Transcript_10407/g.29687 Transcript_10407/m.29687 type:complete len:266 (+) Transcript_10407:713-1510(+)